VVSSSLYDSSGKEVTALESDDDTDKPAHAEESPAHDNTTESERTTTMKTIFSLWRHRNMRKIGISLAVLALIAGAVGCDYIPRYELYISSTEGGSVTVPGEGTFGSYGDCESVTLMAEPDEGYEFDRWTGDVKHIRDVHAANTTITMWDDYSIKANFKKSAPISWPLIGGIIAAAVVIGAGLAVFFVRRRRKSSTGKEVVPPESDNDTESPADTEGISMKQDLVEPEREPIKMGFGGKFTGFVRDPATTFQELKEETLGGALKYTLICLAIFGVAAGLVSSLPFTLTGVAMREMWFGGASNPLGSILGGALSWISITVGLSIVGGLLFIFIGGAWIHLWVYLLGGRKSHGYRQTVKALAYGVTPMCVVGWVPLIGGLAGGIWALVVAIIGLRELHGMTTGKAIAAYLLPAAIVFIVIVVIAVRLFLEIVGLFW
jgi:hypothetical protein